MGHISKLLVLLVVLLSGCNRLETRQEKHQPVPVRVQEITYSKQVSQRTFVGTVKASAEVTVSAKFPGQLSKVYVKQGDVVRQGQILAEVESQAVLSSYDMAQATLKQAEDAYARLMKVKATNSIPDIKLVEIETKLKQARAQAVAAEKSLGDCKLKSPFNGVVGEVHANVGGDLSLLQPVFTVFDVSSLEVHIAVPETEVGKYSVGDSALVVVPALGDSRFSAVIATKGIAASAVSHSYDFTLSLVDDANGMMPGMVTKVYVDDANQDYIIIPSSIVKIDNNGKYIWVVENGIVVKRYIEVMGFADRGVIVSKGLSQGDLVITEGSRKVCSGTNVVVRE